MSIYSQEKIFYVYAYLRSRNSKFGCVGSPYYIGKGHDYRLYDKKHTFFPPKDKSRIVILFENLTEETAFQIEMFFIRLFGRIDLETGILRNRTDGGEGVKGRSPESLALFKKARKENPFHHTEITISRMLRSKEINGTRNSNTIESIQKTKETKIKNNTYKRANSAKSINSGVATRKKNGSYIRSEKSKQQQKDTWRRKRNAGIKGPIKSPEQIAKITASRKVNGSYKRTQKSIEKQLKTYYENKKKREENNPSSR